MFSTSSPVLLSVCLVFTVYLTVTSVVRFVEVMRTDVPSLVKLPHEAPNKISVSLPGECDKYAEAVGMERVLHPDILDSSISEKDLNITMVTQLDSNRLEVLENLINGWKAPMSIAIYVNETKTNDIIKLLDTMSVGRSNIAFHLLIKKGDYYPVNKLRNIAIEGTRTEYVFLNDVDFLVCPHLDSKLMYYLENPGVLPGKFNDANRVLVVPAFEHISDYAKYVPETKEELLNKWLKPDSQCIKPFHFRINNGVGEALAGHRPTDYKRWKDEKFPYTAIWKEGYEPYIAMSKKRMPRFNEHFVGRYFNKAIQSLYLYAMDYRFVVLPDVYLIHAWHEPTPWSDTGYRCGSSTLRAIKDKINKIHRGKFDAKLGRLSLYYKPNVTVILEK